jgi:hypothetical protein
MAHFALFIHRINSSNLDIRMTAKNSQDTVSNARQGFALMILQGQNFLLQIA